MRRLSLLSLFLAMSAAPALGAERVEMSGGGSEIYSLGYAATGAAEAGGLVRGCPGFAEAGPAVSVGLAAPGELHLYLSGEGLAGALVVRPDGLHLCETPNVYGYVGFALRGAAAGEWAVHPLAAAAGAAVSGVAIVSGYEVGVRDAVSYMGLRVDPSILPPLLSEVPLDPAAPPAAGAVDLPAAGELSLPVTLAGLVPADEAGLGCAGLIDQTRPDARLTLAADEPLLVIRAEAEPDTTLLVMGPDGAVRCSDDAVGVNPAVVIEGAAAGAWAVWVGVYPGGEGGAATLAFGRTAPEGVAPGAGAPPPDTLASDAPPALGVFDLPAEGATTEVGLVVAGGAYAGNYDASCSGEIDPTRPDAVVIVTEPAPLWLLARSEAADTTLLVLRPDGVIACNDDWLGSNAGLSFDPATPGSYAVWVGAFGGGAGAEATLVVSRAAPEGGGAAAAPAPNPFLGKDLPTAVAALEALREDPDFASQVSWERLEETGPEGFTLHGVAIADPSGQNAPQRIARVVVTDLDLAGLSAAGAPERFSIVAEGVDYAALASAAAAGGPPLPLIDGAPALSVGLSLLPPAGDATRRELKFRLDLEKQLGLALAARMIWPEGALAMGPEAVAAASRTEAVEIALDDMGFLGAFFERVAAESGGQPADLIATALTELEGALAAMGPYAPDSPRGKLHAAVAARLGDLGRPGTIRIRLSSPEALDAETAFGALMADAPDPAVIAVEIVHEPR